MSELRLILLITGVFAVISLYVWETLKVRRTAKSRRNPKAGASVPDKFERGPVDPGREDYLRTLAELSDLADTNLKPGTSTEFERLSTIDEEPPDRRDPPAEEVITLHVIAMPGNSFHGKNIMRAAGKVGMRHGSMNIFHFYCDQSAPDSEIQFSLSNMFEPGTLAPEQMRDFHTTGVTLFMRLLSTRDNAPGFELMLSAARQLADELRGQVCGPGRVPLNDIQLSKLRDKVGDRRGFQPK